MGKDKGRAKSTAMPTASTSLSPVHQPRKITLFCWILDLSDKSFSVDIEDNLTVGHLKDVIVKKNPASFEGVDAYELDLWGTRSAINNFLKMM